jgi:uncharacterized protein GlcG (DUF336 family)
VTITPLILFALAAASPSTAPLARQTVSLALANAMVGEALRTCRSMGRSAVVAVVDRGGNLVALQRDDDVGPHNALAAQRKAFTALSTKTATSTLSERAATDPTARNLATIPELLMLGGGIPIIVDGDTIGAIGVAGAGGSANDERCAKAAVVHARPAASTQ